MKNADTRSGRTRPDESSRASDRQYLTFAKYTLVATLVVASVVLLLIFVWYTAGLLLLVFAGVLISILLRGVARLISRFTGLGRGVSIAATALLLAAAIVGVTWLVTTSLGAQIDELQTLIPAAIDSVNNYAGSHEWARQMISGLPSVYEWFRARSGTVISGITGIASSTVSIAVNVIVVLVIGLYLAIQPSLYSGGALHLFPARFRERVDEAFSVLDENLWRWLGGRFSLMLTNGTSTAIGLWLLDVPLALTLGIIAGLLNFIPTFGPWIAAVPAVLVGFLQGPQQALYVAILYLVLQMLDAYVLTPLIDRKSVDIPPAVTIVALLLLGFAFGFLGLLLASPLTATIMILIKMFYVEDLLGEPIMDEQEGEDASEANAGREEQFSRS